MEEASNVQARKLFLHATPVEGVMPSTKTVESRPMLSHNRRGADISHWPCLHGEKGHSFMQLMLEPSGVCWIKFLCRPRPPE